MFVLDCIPCDLWKVICQIACGGSGGSGGITEKTKWGNLFPTKVRSLADTIVACTFEFNGRLAPQTEGAAAVGDKDMEDHYFVNAG